MRLWHESLISKLPQQQLCGQWRECIALLGNGWGRKHSTVDYVFTHSESFLVGFAIKVCYEMIARGYHPNPKLIRQALMKRYNEEQVNKFIILGKDIASRGIPIYKEHNKNYLIECITNLKNKGIEI